MRRLRLRKIWVAFQGTFVRLRTEPVSTERSVEVHLMTEAQRLAREWDAAHPREPEPPPALNPLPASGKIGVTLRNMNNSRIEPLVRIILR